MFRVEMMGPPGVGKSTLFRAACAARNVNTPEFYERKEIRRCIGRAELWVEFARFLDLAYEGLPSENPIHARRLVVTQRALNRARKIEMAAGCGPVLIDEGLCQRGLSLALSRPGNDEVQRYFELMPAPAAVFVVLADHDAIKARNVARNCDGSGIDRSFDTDACLACCGIAATQLRKRGVNVIEIDAGRPVEAATARVMLEIRALAC